MRETREMEEFATLAPLLRPYLAAAAGAARDDEGRFNVIALVHETEEAAEENADRLRVRVRDVIERNDSSRGPISWSELISSVETVIDGNILIARLRTPEDYFTRIVVGQNNNLNLLVHE